MRRGRRATRLCALVAALAITSPVTGASAGIAAQDAVHGKSEARRSVPFTGLDLALILGGGSALIVAGAGLRGIARRRA